MNRRDHLQKELLDARQDIRNLHWKISYCEAFLKKLSLSEIAQVADKPSPPDSESDSSESENTEISQSQSKAEDTPQAKEQSEEHGEEQTSPQHKEDRR